MEKAFGSNHIMMDKKIAYNDIEMWDDEGDYTLTAHRGGAHLFLENSFLAFKGIMSDVEIVECDVHMTLDDKVIVFHDPVLDDFFKDFSPEITGAVSSWALDDLIKLRIDPKEPNNHLVSLEWLIDYCKRRSALLQIDLKADVDEGIYPHMVHTIQSMLHVCRTPDSVRFITFFGEYCEMLKEHDLIRPHTQFLLDQQFQERYGYYNDVSLKRLLDAWGITCVGMDIDDDVMIDLISHLDVQKSFWGVNDSKTYHKARRLGACNITTDNPRLACFSL